MKEIHYTLALVLAVVLAITFDQLVLFSISEPIIRFALGIVSGLAIAVVTLKIISKL